MDPFSAMLFALAVTWYGSRSGAATAVRAVRDNHRQRKQSRPEPRPSVSGVRAGRVVSAGLTAGGLAVRDFRTGWRAGWGDGRQRAREWRDRRRDQHDARTLTITPPTSRPLSPTNPAEAPTNSPQAPTELQLAAPVSLAKTPADGRPAPVIPLTKGTPAMPANPTAEVNSLPELLAFLEQVEKDAQAEFEDAQARETRAKQAAADIETVLGQLTKFELGPADLNAVGALLDPTAAAEKAATTATEAADHTHVTAQTAHTAIAARHSAMQEAVDATPEPASMDWYKNGQHAA